MNRILLLCALAAACSSAEAQPASANGPRQVASTGYVDPTANGFNGGHPMVSCSSSCSASLINQNTDALQKAFDLANGATHPWVHVPAGEYPVFRGGTLHNQKYGVLLNGYSGLVLDAPGAIFRINGNCGQSDYYMVELTAGTNNVRFLPGAVFSGRDANNCSEHAHIFQVGDSLSVVDNVSFVGLRFVEPTNPGDCINLLGGYEATHLVQRISIVGNFMDCHRAAVTFQHGTDEIDIVGNWMQGSTYADNIIDHEPTSPGGNADENVIGNLLNATGADGASLMTISGYSGSFASQNVYAYNTILGGVSGGNVRRDWIYGNVIAASHDRSSVTVQMFRRANDNWFVGNYISRGGTSNAASLILLSNNNGFAPTNAWIRDNTLEQFSSASSTITCVAKASMVDTDYMTLADAASSTSLYEFDVAGDGVTGGRVQVNISTDTTAAQVCARLRTAILATQTDLDVFDDLAGDLTVTKGNLTSATENVANSGFVNRLTIVGSGVELDGVSNFYVDGNTMRHRSTMADAGSGTGFIGVFARSQTIADSGWIVENRALRGTLADGVTQAGRMLFGIDFSSESYKHIGHGTIRDNLVDGAKNTYFINQAATTFDETYTLVQGNVALNVVADSLPSLFVVESTGQGETVASGALSPSRRNSFVTANSAGTTHSLADGTADGFVKHVKWTGGSGDDTLTPAHLGDGTSITASAAQIAAGAYADLAWDDADGTWRLLGSASITVVP